MPSSMMAGKTRPSVSPKRLGLPDEIACAIFRALEKYGRPALQQLRDCPDLSENEWAKAHRIAHPAVIEWARDLRVWWSHPSQPGFLAKNLHTGHTILLTGSYSPEHDRREKELRTKSATLPKPDESKAMWLARATELYRIVQDARGAGRQKGGNKPDLGKLQRYADWFVMRHVAGMTVAEIFSTYRGDVSAIRKGIGAISKATGLPSKPAGKQPA